LHSAHGRELLNVKLAEVLNNATIDHAGYTTGISWGTCRRQSERDNKTALIPVEIVSRAPFNNGDYS